jgi:hypothetical protein
VQVHLGLMLVLQEIARRARKIVSRATSLCLQYSARQQEGSSRRVIQLPRQTLLRTSFPILPGMQQRK